VENEDESMRERREVGKEDGRGERKYIEDGD
jgi:hypothetical protein